MNVSLTQLKQSRNTHSSHAQLILIDHTNCKLHFLREINAYDQKS